MASSKTMRSQERENTDGMMARFTKDFGSKTRCTGMENFLGQMERCMREISETIKDTAMELSSGKMEKCTEARGIKENSTEKVLL